MKATSDATVIALRVVATLMIVGGILLGLITASNAPFCSGTSYDAPNCTSDRALTQELGVAIIGVGIVGGIILFAFSKVVEEVITIAERMSSPVADDGSLR